jgi:hypothetical protein
MPDARAVEAVRMLDALLLLFGDGKHWTRYRDYDGRGSYCLVGAMDYIQQTQGIAPAASVHYLRAVIWPCGGMPPDAWRGRSRYPRRSDLILFNDGRKNFRQLRTMIERARAMAQRHLDQPLPAELERAA